MANILEIVAGDPQFSLLVGLVNFADAETGADVAGTLATEGLGATLFAPTNAALTATATELGFAGGTEDETLAFLVQAFTDLSGGDPGPLVLDVLTYHVAPVELAEADVQPAAPTSVKTLLGPDLGIAAGALIDLDTDNADAAVGAFTDADNGSVFAIDALLLPVEVAAIPAPDPDEEIVSEADQLPDLGYPGLFPGDPDPLDDRDDILTGSGNDIVRSGDDADRVATGAGDDSIDGGVDRDTIESGDGNDTVVGSEGSDVITLGAGDDLAYGGLDPSFPDELNIRDDGGDEFGPDLVTDNGRDTIDGGAGNDTLFGQDDRDFLIGGDGEDSLDGGIDRDKLFAGRDDDTLIGGQGDDKLNGGAGDDSVSGGDGDDRVAGNSGDDTIEGGGGDDRLLGRSGDDVGRGGNGDDTLEGHGGDDTLSGGEGDDLILGGEGDDSLGGGAGANTLTGGDGADTFSFGTENQATTITDYEAGTDTVALADLGEAGTYTFTTGAGDGDDLLITTDANADWSVLVLDTDEIVAPAPPEEGPPEESPPEEGPPEPEGAPEAAAPDAEDAPLPMQPPEMTEAAFLEEIAAEEDLLEEADLL